MTPAGPAAGRLDGFLGAAEVAVRLIERCCPRNLASEHSRLISAVARGARCEPHFAYDAPPDLSDLREALGALVERFESSGSLARLYALRAAELEQDAALAEAVGTPRLRHLAGARHRPAEPAVGGTAIALATEWACAAPGEGDEPRFVSHDATSPESLVSVLRREVGRCRLPARVVVRDDLASVAAVGDGVVLVCAARRLTAAAAERIALHEVAGHLAPRVAGARSRAALAACGTHGSSEDEEGRALLLELRAGRLDRERRAELGRRHLLAEGVCDGAAFEDSLSQALSLGASPELAVREASRVHRGGGLARERVYLPALLRVAGALDGEPDLEAWLASGRRGVDAARTLAGLSVPGASAHPEVLHPSAS